MVGTRFGRSNRSPRIRSGRLEHRNRATPQNDTASAYASVGSAHMQQELTKYSY